MKLKYFIILTLSLLSFQQGQAAIVPSNITQDTVLDASLSPWTVNNNVTIAAGVTVILDTNAVLSFNSSRQMIISPGATFQSFGGTISSSSSSPTPGSWNRILNRGDLILDNCIIEYGDNAIVLDGGSADINNCTFSQNEVPIRVTAAGDYYYNKTNSFLSNSFDAIFHEYASITSTIYTIRPSNAAFYMLNGMNVDQDSYVYVDPGCVIKLIDDAIDIYGGFEAVGTATEKIIFTSWRDDNIIGDSNNDGSSSAPNEGDWDAIRFNNGSLAGTTKLEYCEISYAGQVNWFGGVICQNASPTIENCEFNSNNFCGLRLLEGSSPIVNNNTFSTSTVVPVAMALDCEPTFTNNVLSGSSNEYEAIGILGTSLTQSATVKKRDFTSIPNITYVVLADVFVPQGITLTIDPGVVIKFLDNSHLHVGGNLQAVGTAAEPIIFTGIADDSHGNPMDTEENGNTHVPNPGDWDGIVFLENSSSSSQMTYCEVDYAHTSYMYLNQIFPLPDYWTLNSGIAIVNSNPTIDSCKVFNSFYGVTCYESAAPTLSNLEIGNTVSAPIGVTADADPTISNITFTNVGLSALGLIGNDVYNSGTISKFDMGGFTNITQVLIGDDLTIRPGANITVEPGVVIKSFNRSVQVHGGFKVSGTATEPVVFTSSRDDNVGNPMDTNGDGNSSNPSVGNWDGIVYLESADDAFNSLEHFELKYAELNIGSTANSRASLEFQSAGGSVSQALITNCNRGIAFTQTATASANEVTITNSEEDPVVLSLVANPTLSNFTFINVGFNTIGVLDQDLNQDVTVGPRDLGGFSPIAYRQISHSLDINTGSTMTLLPGTVWKMTSSSSSLRWHIDVFGALIANGTDAEPIIFTSTDDDSAGGDSGADGNTTQPDQGDWEAILFWPSSDDSKNRLTHCQLRYGGHANFGFSSSPIDGNRPYEDYGLVRVKNAKVHMEDCELSFSSTTGLGIYGSADPDVINCNFSNIAVEPVELAMFSNPNFSGNTVSNVGAVALRLLAEIYSQDATLIQRDFAGYQNITYTTRYPLVIASGTHITVLAGTVFKNRGRVTSSDEPVFDVEGRISILGTVAEPVILTTTSDDEYGNPKDTRQDGVTSLNVDNWRRRYLIFRSQSDDQSLVQHTKIRYSGQAIECQSASPTIDQCEIYDFNEAGLYLTGISEPSLMNTSFDQGNQVPILTNTLSYIDTLNSGGNSILGSTWRGIGLERETLVQDTRLPKRNFAGINAIPYILTDDIDVGTSAVLTIDPGVIIKVADNNYGIDVFNGLIAEGGDLPEEKIVITGIADDFYGGDTDANGEQNWPLSSGTDSWEGISFFNSSIDADCRLRNVILRDANRAVYCESASPSIDKVLFQYHDEGVACVGASNPVVDSCDFQDIRFSAVFNNNPSFTIKAENCFWNDCSGPTHSSNPGGSGESVTDFVDFEPWVCEVQNAVFGDVSRNGEVQAFDAALVLQSLASLTALDAEQVHLGDVSGTAGLSALDASLILQYVVGIIHNFPAENLLRDDWDLTPSDVVVEVPDQFVHPGDTMTLPIYLKNVENIYAMDWRMFLPDEIFKLIEVDMSHSDYSDLQSIHSHEEGYLRWVGAGTEAAYHDGLLATIKVKVKEDAPTTFLQLNFERAWANEADVSAFAQPATISIKGTTSSNHVPNDLLQQIQVWPNPFRDQLTVSLPNSLSEAIHLQLRDAMGQLLWQKHIQGSEGAQKVHIGQLEQFPAGMYFLRCESKGRVYNLPVLRQ